MKILAAFMMLLNKIAPLLALWLANLAGKRAGRAERDAEQNAINAKAREEYEKIEMREDDGKWLK